MVDDQETYSKNPEGERVHGGGYSDRKKIPTVQKFTEEERQKREEARKQDVISKKKGLARVVRDPITGEQVQIVDSKGDHRYESENLYITVPRRNVISTGKDADIHDSELKSEGIHISELQNDPNSDQNMKHFGQFLGRKSSKSSRTSGIGRRKSLSTKSENHNEKKDDKADCSQTNAHDEEGWVDLPMRGNRTNIMYYTLPDPDFDVHHKVVMDWFLRWPLFVLGGELFRFFVIDFGRVTAVLMYVAAGYWIKEQMDISWSATKLDTVKRRADQALARRIPESVEWLNALLNAIWKQVNPEIFAAAVDKLEDIMQASAPSIIHGVKIDDVGHGDHPVRLLNMRYLEDKEVADDADNNTEDQHPGDFVNMEVSVAYSATPSGSTAASKVKNMHVLVVFYSGLANVLAVPIPFWVEIIGFIATLRLRMQFTPEFPYIKNTTFSLLGLPKFEISVVPLFRKLFNVTNLPIISIFVKKSIQAACNEYVAPKSYTIDIGQIIADDDIVRECVAIGVVVVHIHRAEAIESKDSNGLSDPYIVVAMSNYGKPIFSSRIIEKTVDPVYGETCFVLVTPESLRNSERLSLQLWDSDRVSADDENGRVEFDLQDLVRNRGSMDQRKDTLVSSADGKPMSGTLHWTVGYFSKRPCNQELSTDGSDANLDDDIKNHPDMKGKKGLPDQSKSRAVSYCPPDPDWPSGVLHIKIHQAVDLYANHPSGSWKPNMHYTQGQDTTGPEVEEDEAQCPSAYCTIIINDQLVYRTRTKPLSNKPFFNANTERFVRDWRTAVCMVAVRDSRTREHDALLGIVPLKLSEVFKNASQVTKNYPLIGGVGEAKVRISLLWESIDHTLDKKLLGWDVGNLRVTSDRFEALAHDGDCRQLKNMTLKMFTSLSSMKVSRRLSHAQKDVVYWNTGMAENEHFELPIINRHSSALCIEFHGTARRSAYAISVLWLTEILDNQKNTIKIPIWRTDTDQKRYQVRQNRVHGDQNIHDMKQIGYLQFDAIFLRGLGASHGKQVSNDPNLRHVHECWQATIAHGQRELDDSFLVGHKKDKNNKKRTENIGADPYSQLNNEALDRDARENVSRNDKSHLCDVENQSTEVDQEGRRITEDTTRWAIAEIDTVEGIAHRAPSNTYSPITATRRSDLPPNQRRSEDLASMKPKDASGIDRPRPSSMYASIGQNEPTQDQAMNDRWNNAWLTENRMGSPISDDVKQSRYGSVVFRGPNTRHPSVLPDSISRSSSSSSSADDAASSSVRDVEKDDTVEQRRGKRDKKAEKRELHRQQRGSMQFKPMRTLKWAKDGVRLGSAKFTDQFKMKSRQPDVQSEV